MAGRQMRASTRLRPILMVGLVALGMTIGAVIMARAQGGELHYGDTVSGTLRAGASDEWTFSASAGDIIALDVKRTAGNLEPALRIQDANGNPIAGTQPATDQATASLVQVRLAQLGSYVVQISANGSTAGSYQLMLTPTASTNLTPTVPPTISAQAIAGTIPLGNTVQGTISNQSYKQTWKFTATSGFVVDIKMTPTSGDLAPSLTLVAPSGDVLATTDTPSAGPAVTISAFQLPFSGDYSVIARRFGPLDGSGGTTSGQYNLAVTVRGPGPGPQNSLLNANSSLQGRLTDSFPRAIYRLQFGGPLAISLNLGRSHRLAEIRLLDVNGSPLQTVQGLSPLTLTTTLPDQNTNPATYYVQVGSTNYESAAAVDFTVSAFSLKPVEADSRPLAFDTTRRASVSNLDHWFFIGHTNDIISLNVIPDPALLGTVVKLTGPQDTVLYQSDLGSGLQQPFTLPKEGLYEIEIRLPAPTPQTLSYSVRVDRLGANNITFDRFQTTYDHGALALTAPTAGTLTSNIPDSWYLDGQAGQVISLDASPTTNGALIGLALDRPDGSVMTAQVSTQNTDTLIQRARLDQTGRYRVVVFDGLASGAKAGYKLSYEDTSGGILQSGQKVKGIVTPDDGIALWSIEAAQGSLINAQLATLTPVAWTPGLFIIEPGGQVIAASNTNGSGNSTQVGLLSVRAPISGSYQIMVAGRVSGNFASYNLTAGVQIPFAIPNPAPIEVSTTRIPADRYAPAPNAAPIHVAVPDLINPPAKLDNFVPTASQTLGFGATVRGEILPGALSQLWRFSTGAKAVLSLRATALSGTTGPQLTLLDANNRVIAEQLHSNDVTTTLNYRSTQGGSYTVVVSMGLNGGRYLLALGSLDVSDAPLKVSDGTPIMYGQTLPGELIGNQASNRYYFMGTANDVISIQVTPTANDPVPGIQILIPDGKAMSGGLTNITLPESGLYTLSVIQTQTITHPTSRYFLYVGVSGGLRLRNRGGGIITPDVAQTGALSLNPNQNTWLFTADQGQRITVTVSGLSDPSPTPLGLRLQDTAGTIFAAQDSTLTQSTVSLSDVVLPAKGVYRVQVIGGDQMPGVYNLRLDTDQARLSAGPLRYGQTVSGIFTTDHKAETWVFSGNANDIVAISLRYVRGDRFNPGFTIFAENGVPLGTVVAGPNNANNPNNPDDSLGARTNNLLLPLSGSYSIVATNPDANYKGSGVYDLTVVLQDSKARSLGSILTPGDRGQGDIYPDDPSDTWVFAARAGDKVVIAAQARDQFLKPLLQLKTPRGIVLASATPGANGASVIDASKVAGATGDPKDGFPILADGVYVITLSGADKTTGSYSVAFDLIPPPIAATATLHYGDSQRGLIADDRPREAYTFTGKAGDSLTTQMKRETGATLSPVLDLETDQGMLLVRVDASNSDSATIANFRLPYTGGYRLVAGRYLGVQGQTAGNYTITLSATPEDQAIKGTAHYGQLSLGRLSDASPIERLTFDGKQGEVVSIATRVTSGNLDPALMLLDPNGAVIASNDDADGVNAIISGVVLPADGTYMIVTTRLETGTVGSTGNYELSLNRAYQFNSTATPKALIAYNQRAIGTVDANNPEARYSFSGSQGDQIGILLVHPNDDAPPMLSIQDPTNTSLIDGKLAVGQTSIAPFTLPINGLYTIVIKRPINTKQVFTPFALTLTLLSSPVGQPTNGGVLPENNAVTGTFAPGQSAHYWLFQGKANEILSVNLLRLNGNLRPSVLLISPTGQSLTMLSIPATYGPASIDRFTLPVDGIYSLLVVPGSADRAGQYRLILQPYAVGATTPSTIVLGQTVSGTLDAVQTSQRWTFTAQKGTAITARLLTMAGDLLPRLQLADADGTLLAEGRLDRSVGISSVIDRLMLPATGPYTLIALSSDGQSSGKYSLSVDTHALAPQLVAASPISYGQIVRGVVQKASANRWVFHGSEGDSVVFAAVPVDPAGLAPDVELLDSAGRSLIKSATGEVPGYVLPSDGRYVVVVTTTASTGYTLSVQRRQDLFQTDPISRAFVPNTVQENGISAGNLVDYWTFQGDIGQVIQIDATRRDGDVRLDLTLVGPSGYITSMVGDSRSGAATIGPLRLAEKGNYQLIVTRWLDAAGTGTGKYRLTLSFPTRQSGVSGIIPAFDRPVQGKLNTATASDSWAFNGQAGDTVNLRLTRLDGDLVPALSIVNDSQSVATATADKDEALIARLTLPATASYTIIASSAGGAGSYKLIVEHSSLADTQASLANAAPIMYGDSKNEVLTLPAPVKAWVFYGKAGDAITTEVFAAANSKLQPSLTLLMPDSRTLAAAGMSVDKDGHVSARLNHIALPTDGFYALLVGSSSNAADEQIGAFTLMVRRDQPGAAYQGQLVVGATQSGTLTADQPIQEWGFEAGSTRTIAADVISSSAAFNGVLRIISASGQVLAVSNPAQAGTATIEAALPASGHYSILLSAATTGEYRLHIGYAIAPTGGGLLLPGEVVFGTLTNVDFSDAWRFDVSNAATLTINIQRTAGDLNPEVTVYGPDGVVILTQGNATNADGTVVIPATHLTATGRYTLLASRVNGAGGQTSGGYRLQIGLTQ